MLYGHFPLEKNPVFASEEAQHMGPRRAQERATD
jgi:hypothetical protein